MSEYPGKCLKMVKPFVRAFVPFPRSIWIHPNAPEDSLDRVCKVIWSRATVLLGGGERSAQCRTNKAATPPHNKPSGGNEEQQKEANNLGLSRKHDEDKKKYRANFIHPSIQISGSRAKERQKEMDDFVLSKYKKQPHTDFTLPRPHPSGCKPLVAKSTQILSPAMQLEIKLKLEEDTEDKVKMVENSPNKMWVPQINRGNQSTEKLDSHFQPQLNRNVCLNEDELDTKSLSDSNTSNDDDFVTLPGVRSCATDSSSAESVNDINEVEGNEIPHHSDYSGSDSEQGFPSFTETDFPQLLTNKAGIPLGPTEPSVLWKVHGQWETPLSIRSHNTPTTTLASNKIVPVQAPVQDKALQANSKTDASPVCHSAYDLLTDFPTLQPPENPLALGGLHHGNFKIKAVKTESGLTLSPNHCQDSVVSHERRLENVPREVSSICSGDQKTVLNLETFGPVSQPNSPAVSCEKVKANKPPPPTVSGADGAGVNARSWVSAAKAGMRQAAAPQEKARPCTFQHIVTINKAKAGNSAAQKFEDKTSSHHRGNLSALHQSSQPQNLDPSVKPVSTPHQRLQQTVRATTDVKPPQPDLCPTQGWVRGQRCPI